MEEKLQEQDPTCVPRPFVSPSLPASNCPFLDQHLPCSHGRGLRQPWAGTLRLSSQPAREIAAQNSGPGFSYAQGYVLSSPHPRYGTLQQTPSVCDVYFLLVPYLLGHFFFFFWPVILARDCVGGKASCLSLTPSASQRDGRCSI